MKINIQYPNYMPRKFTKEVIDLFFKEGYTYQQISAKLGKHRTLAEKVVQIYLPKLYYDKDLLLERMKNHRDSLEYKEQFKEVTGLNYNYIRLRLMNNNGVSLKTQLDLCRQYDLDVSVEWGYNPIDSWHDIDGVETPSEIAKNRIDFKPTRRNNRRSKFIPEDDSDLQEKGDISEVATNTALIENYRKQMKKFLIDKWLSIETVNYVLDKSDSIARESTLFGIQCERLGKGQKLEQSIITQFQTFRD